MLYTVENVRTMKEEELKRPVLRQHVHDAIGRLIKKGKAGFVRAGQGHEYHFTEAHERKGDYE